jgi:hypothetical protein
VRERERVHVDVCACVCICKCVCVCVCVRNCPDHCVGPDRFALAAAEEENACNDIACIQLAILVSFT